MTLNELVEKYAIEFLVAYKKVYSCNLDISQVREFSKVFEECLNKQTISNLIPPERVEVYLKCPKCFYAYSKLIDNIKGLNPFCPNCDLKDNFSEIIGVSIIEKEEPCYR